MHCLCGLTIVLCGLAEHWRENPAGQGTVAVAVTAYWLWPNGLVYLVITSPCLAVKLWNCGCVMCLLSCCNNANKKIKMYS